jgi:cytochrome c2
MITRLQWFFASLAPAQAALAAGLGDAKKAEQLYEQRWDEAALNAWLADAEKRIPGQRGNVMVASAADRGDLVAYLRGVSK